MSQILPNYILNFNGVVCTLAAGYIPIIPKQARHRIISACSQLLPVIGNQTFWRHFLSVICIIVLT